MASVDAGLGVKTTVRNELWLLALLALAFALYWPGLLGGYIFDDSQFIVDNTDMHVDSLRPGAWALAANSFPSGQQGRWLTMLSFAANYYFTGLDPFWIKLTNLAIHLANGVLLYLVLTGLLRLFGSGGVRVPVADARADVDPKPLALWITAAWLLLPINLTAVLYAAQRLESLSTLFILLGLAWYVRARLRLHATGRGWHGMIASLLVCTGVGLLAKESAVLLPVYALLIEFCLGSFSSARRAAFVRLYGAIIGLPLVVGVAWLATWVGTSAAPARAFTTAERLMTEARVLIDYVFWCLVPVPRVLNLYHDDIVVSTGLFAPATTLFSMAAIAGLIAFALWQRSRRPLLSLGILWFFAAHLLTATIIPLELVYEHRNYFASCGLLLALLSVFSLQPLVRLSGALLGVIGVALLAFYALNLNLRAREWGNPVRLALSEVDKRPKSPRAQYELGRTLTIAAHFAADSPMNQRGLQALDACRALPRSGILCEQALIIVAANQKSAIDPAWWDAIVRKLTRDPATESDAGALTSLLDCQRQGVCPHDKENLGRALDAVIARGNPAPRILEVYADYAALLLDDYDLAERTLRQVIAQKPGAPGTRANLIELLLARGKRDEAQEEWNALEKLNRFGSLDPILAALKQQIDAVAS